MSIALQQAVNALSLAGLYCLLAMGITLVFGLARLVNFAHAALGVLAAYIALGLGQRGFSFTPAFFLATAAVAVLSLVLYRVLLLRTLETPLNGFIVSLGILLIIQGLLVKGYSLNPKLVPPPAGLEGKVEFGGAIITEQGLFNLVVTVLLTAGVVILLRFSSFGRTVSAVAEDLRASELVGVNVRWTIGVTFVLGTALSGAAGILSGALVPFDPYTGNDLLIKAFAVSLVGGLGNVNGAIVAAILLATFETLGTAYWNPEWTGVYGLAFIIIVLLVRPGGLFKPVGRAAEGLGSD